MRNLFFIAVIFAFLAGCTTIDTQRKTVQSYSLNAMEVASVGGTMLVDQDGEIKVHKRWVGLMNAPGGWLETPIYTPDFYRKELIYSGKNSGGINISYREFRGGLAAPAFYQNLQYDLEYSNIISFQNFTLKVHSATNQKIKFEVLSD